MRPDTAAIHAGYAAHGPGESINPPLHTSTVWTHPDTGLDRSPGSTAYARFANPNRNAFEAVMCALEDGERAMAFASGIAAIHAIFQALDPGDHVLVCDDVYFGTRVLLNGFLKRWGIEATYADATDPEAFMGHIRPETKLIWLETPSNPRLLVTDLRRIRALAPDHRIVVDNTWATPVFQRPLTLGADIVMHSASKYLGGHSDILNGVVVCKTSDAFSHVGAKAVPIVFKSSTNVVRKLIVPGETVLKDSPSPVVSVTDGTPRESTETIGGCSIGWPIVAADSDVVDRFKEFPELIPLTT